MKPQMIAKICVDSGMTVVLLFLMTYEMIGQALHEWLGVGMFLLFVIHHVLNRRWFGVLLKGKYTTFRIWQTAVVAVYGMYAFVKRDIGNYMLLKVHFVFFCVTYADKRKAMNHKDSSLLTQTINFPRLPGCPEPAGSSTSAYLSEPALRYVRPYQSQ